MESKAMLPDSTQSETLPPAKPSVSDAPSGAIPSSSPSTSQPKKDDNTTSKKKKKKRKSEDKSTKNSKKKKPSKGKTHKEQKSKKSKTATSAPKKPEPEEPDSDLDLEKDVKPIRDYVKDREDMLQHMFKSVTKAKKLQAMLPDILKNVPVEELQHLCLLQLEGMSKSRIMSILAGEEMQSSSDEEESDLEMERNRLKTGDATDILINSEVVDSTSSLLQAAQAVEDAEKAMSVQAVEDEAAGMDSEAEEVEYEEADSNASVDGSWQNDSDRGQHYSDEDIRDEMDDDRRESESDREMLTDEGRDRNIPEEEEETPVVSKPKKYRRIKIIRAEGEECEEGEITSDEVETDEESVTSDKEASESVPETQVDGMEGKPGDTHPEGAATHPDGADTHPEGADMHPGGAEMHPEGVETQPGATSGGDSATLEPSVPSEGSHSDDAKGIPPNSGNQGNDENCYDDSVDVDDSNANVVVMNVANVEPTSDIGSAETDNDKAITDNNQTSEVQTAQDVSDDALNIFAEEDNLESASQASSTHKVAGDVAENDPVNESAENTDSNVIVDGKINDDKKTSEQTICDSQENSSSDVNTEESEPCVERTESVVKSTAPPKQVKGATGTASKTGRKVAQELEVLELELRARAIRSLMKKYGKDVG